MAPFGPQYCETPSDIDGLFPVEPANAYSSMIIVVWGLVALWLVWRRAPRSWPLYLAVALLVTNGVGSTLWHGLRTRWSLVLDWLPAVIFVVVVALLWARRVAPLWQGLILATALIATPFALRLLNLNLPFWGPFAASAIVILVGAAWLIVRTRSQNRGAALTGLLAVAFAFSALAFRSGDAYACEQLGIGSHFLWHIFLSTAAFLSVWTVVRLEPKSP